MYAHLQQKMDNIAVMKSLGGTSAEIIRIYVIQTLMLGLLGGIAGVLLGRAVEQVFPSLINKIFEIKAAPGWHFDAAIQGISVGLLTTLLFTLPPLVAIRKIRPAMILRRGMADTRLSFRGRIASAREAVVLGGIILLGLGGIAAWLAGSARVGGYFAAGLVFSLLALTAVAAVLLRLLRVVVRRSPVRLPSLVRQGFANLYRPGNQAQSILVAMGLGVMFTLSVYLIQHSLIDEIIQTAPPGVPNV
jgi:putative ABC transport system permease protein